MLTESGSGFHRRPLQSFENASRVISFERVFIAEQIGKRGEWIRLKWATGVATDFGKWCCINVLEQVFIPYRGSFSIGSERSRPAG